MVFNNTLLRVFLWMICVLPYECIVEDKKLEACYGDGWQLLPSCDFEELVYPHHIFFGAKDPNSCPAVLHKNETNSNLTDLCCRIDQYNTCGGLVNISNYRTYKDYFGNCIGEVQCTDVPIERTQSSAFSSTCNPQFHENTTLVTMIYQCVKGVRNIFNTDIITNHSDIHLKGQEYSNPILQRRSDCNNVDDVIQCSVEAKGCDDEIDVQAWDLRLECGQELWFCNLNETVKLTCNNNTGIQKTDMYQSLSNYVIVTFKNSLSRDGGFFWFVFNPVPVNSSLTVSCPVKKPSCPRSSSCQTLRRRTCLSDDTEDDNILFIIAGAVGCVILFIIIVVVILIVIKWKHRQRKKIDPNTETTQKNLYDKRNRNGYIPELQTASQAHILHTNYRLPPILTTKQHLEKEKSKKQKREKKKKKERREKLQSENNTARDLNGPSTSREVTEISGGRKGKKKKKNRVKDKEVEDTTDKELKRSILREESELSEGRKQKKIKKRKSKKNKDNSKDNESMGD